MKKTWLYPCLSLTAVCALATTVQAAVPGIVYIPTDDVEVIPSGAAGDPRCAGIGTVHSGLGCLNVAEATTFEAYAEAAELTEEMRGALADFGVTLTNDRPPKYVPFMMLLPSDVVLDESPSFTCTTGAIDCGTVHRRRIGRTIGGSAQCTEPEQLHAALYAFGRLSGLEGVDNPDDVMGYQTADPEVQPINWSTTPEFLNECSPRSLQWAFNDRDMIVPQTAECTNADHVGCDMDQQNSVLDLLEAYGEPTEDTEPPVITITSPEDGAVFTFGEVIQLQATVEDDDEFVGAMWTLQGEGLVDTLVAEDTTVGTDTWEFCTNRACRPLEGGLLSVGEAAWGWNDGNTSKPTESAFNFVSGPLFQPGTYTATFEATDLHGNVAEPVSVTFTVEAAPPGEDETGSDDNGDNGDDATATSPFTTTNDDGGTGDGSGSGSGGGDDDSGGCSCTTGTDTGGAVGAFALMLGLAGLRRRRR